MPTSILETGGRYPPGTTLAGRYRTVALIGKGSMGEVYLADDLLLSESVALKFLPVDASEDPELMERFVTEVRLARKVTHPNVARVHDIRRADGRTFLTMEYVDGEDLDQLLKRIGRLPAEKALDIARQICEGLYAAHDRGVLHRDLKPSNLMLDSTGRICITDFGLAELVRDGSDGRVMGTPAYMSPEQITGKAVTVRSDIYSLGLVLYEIFTGKRAFNGTSFADYVQMQQHEEPSPPTTVLDLVDSDVESIILQCIAKDPDERPASARQVTLGLPGCDPLATALLSGDIPAPELVAAAGNEEAAPVGRVKCLFIAWLMLLAGILAMVPSDRGQQLVAANELPPMVLRDRIHTLLADIGYPTRPADQGEWYADGASSGFADLPLVFHYRQSPQVLRRHGLSLTHDDPAPLLPGMVAVTVDASGRLLCLSVVPGGPDAQGPEAEPTPVAEHLWDALFEAAGFERSSLESTAARFLPAVQTSERHAWRSIADAGNRRITTAGLGGLPVLFRVEREADVAQGSSAGDENVAYASTGEPRDNDAPADPRNPSNAVGWISLSILAAGTLLAWANVRRGHSDRKGAWRLGLFGFLTHLVYWLGVQDHPADARAIAATLVPALGYCTMIGLQVFVFYLALEPFARRRWPAVLISWSRVLTGRLSDPIVGRDILVGGVATLAGLLLAAGLDRLLWAVGLGGAVSPRPFVGMEGWPAALGVAAHIAGDSVMICLLLLLTLLLMRSWIGVRWLASAIWVAGLAASMAVTSDFSVYAVATSCGFMLLFLALLTRYGIVACIVSFYVQGLLRTLDQSVDPGSWHIHTTVISVCVLVGLAAWAYRAAMAGRPAFSELD